MQNKFFKGLFYKVAVRLLHNQTHNKKNFSQAKLVNQTAVGLSYPLN